MTEEQVYLNAMLDSSEVISVEEFDVFFKISIYNNNKAPVEMGAFNLNDKTYKIMQQSDEKGNLTILINYEENTLMEIPMMEFIDGLFDKANEPKAMMTQENLTIQKQNEDLRIKLLINSLYVDKSTDTIYINGDAYVFATEPSVSPSSFVLTCLGLVLSL